MARNRALHLILLPLILFSLAAFAQASADWHSRPGTVLHTRALPENTSVVLDGMVVVENRSPYLIVKDPWSGENYLYVCVGACDIEQWTSVEITGYTAIADGEMTVVATRVRQYLTPNGLPFIFMPKGIDGPYECPDMREIPIGQRDTSRSLQQASRSLAEDIPPVQPPPAIGTLQWAKSFANDTLLEAPLTGKIVTAAPADFPGAFYIEEPDRTAGIRVTYAGTETPARGHTVTVRGTIGVGADGERQIVADTDDVTVTSTTSSELAPLGMAGWTLTTTYGPDITGMLVKGWGRVKSLDSGNTSFTVNDGSSATHIKINWRWATPTPPEPDNQVTVMGIAGIENGNRVIRPRSASDVHRLDPPVPTVTAPVGTTSDIAPVVTWTAPIEFDRYRVLVQAGTITAWDSSVVTGTDLSAQIESLLTDGVTYSVRVGIHTIYGWGWSQPIQFSLVFAAPPLPGTISYCPK